MSALPAWPCSEDAPYPVDATEALVDVRDQFPRLDLAALVAADRPPREWVVHGLIPAGASISLVAPAGVGKSLLALGLALAVASGDRDFAGLPIPRRRRVLYVDMENTHDDLAERLTDFGVTSATAADYDDLNLIHLPDLPPLDTMAGGAVLAAVVDGYELERGDLVVLDSTQRVIAGPENDSDTIRAYYRHTGRHLKGAGLTVLRTDNSGKDVDRGARGSSGKRDDVDAELLLSRDADNPNVLIVKPGKVRIPDLHSIRVAKTQDDDGILTFTTSQDPHRRAILDAVAEMNRLNIPLDASARAAENILRNALNRTPRAVIREASRERKACAESAPRSHGAPDTTRCAAP